MVALVHPIDVLYAKLGDKVKENVSLAPYTSARIGGPADILITAESADELARTIKLLRKQEIDYIILGGGSNVLVSDRGVRGVVVLNRAKGVRFHNGDQPRSRRNRVSSSATSPTAVPPKVWLGSSGLPRSLARLVARYMAMPARSAVTWLAV